MPELDEFEAASRILDLMIARTAKGTMDWKARGSERDAAFEVDLPSGNVEVGTADNDGVSPHDFRVFKPGPEYGLVIEIDGRSVPEMQPKIAELWALVDRQVRGVDDVLRNILRDLGDDTQA